jgi:Tol biopolymer transport system component
MRCLAKGGLLLLALLMVQEQVLAQGRGRYGRRSGDDPSLDRPAQRTPAPASEVDLSGVPFRIVFESLRETDGRENWEICMIDPDGSGFVNLTSTPDIDEFYPHASPDGSMICFVADEGEDRFNMSRNAYYMRTDGSGRTLIAENVRQPCWNADGTRIAYLKGEYSRYNSSSWSNRGLEIYDLETGEVTPHPNDDIGLIFNLCWSPDGEWFTATSRGRSMGSNIAFRADSDVVKSLSIRGCRPDISADGTRISWGRTDYDLTVGNLDLDLRGSPVTDQEIVVACDRGYKVYHVDWSPDGKYLAFSYGSSRGNQAVGSRAPGWNICVYSFESGRWTQVTTDGRHCKEPDWVATPGRRN